MSPSKDLLKRYKDKKIDFALFGRLFLEEIQKPDVIEICREITYESIKGKAITLLCYEKEESICHRKFIRKLFEQESSKARWDHSDWLMIDSIVILNPLISPLRLDITSAPLRAFF